MSLSFIFLSFLFNFHYAYSLFFFSISSFGLPIFFSEVFLYFFKSSAKYTLAFLRLLRLTAFALGGRAAKKNSLPEVKSEVGKSGASYQSEVVGVSTVFFG